MVNYQLHNVIVSLIMSFSVSLIKQNKSLSATETDAGKRLVYYKIMLRLVLRSFTIDTQPYNHIFSYKYSYLFMEYTYYNMNYCIQ